VKLQCPAANSRATPGFLVAGMQGQQRQGAVTAGLVLTGLCDFAEALAVIGWCC